MNYYQSNYREIRQNGNQKSFECMEEPQFNEYYVKNKSLCHKKPKKIIVTEIYDELIPKNIYRKKQEYFTKSSLPFNSQQRFQNMSQNQLISKNDYYATEGKNENYNSMIDSKRFSDYNKKLYFGRTDLREEFSPTSNDRVDIRKKVYRSGTPPHPFRNGYNLETDENFVENFQYYESKNIKDKNNKKYESITRVTGYSNLIPLRKNQIQHNYTTMNIHRNLDNYNNINSSKYENIQEIEHNLSNIDINKNNSLFSFKNLNIEPKKPQSEEKVTKVEVKKTTQIFENKRKHQLKPETKPNNTNVQTITKKTNIQTTTKTTNTQNVPKATNKQTSVTKYESKKAKPEEKKITNVYVQKKIEKKYEIQKKPQNTTKTNNISSVQNTNLTKKYETYKNTQNTSKASNVSNVSNVQSKNITKKYEASKNLQNTASKSTSNITTQKNNDKNIQKNYTKIKIDTSKYTRTNGEKLYFKKGHGGYSYKDSISEKDVLNSRNDKNVNTNKVEIVQHNSKLKEKNNSISNNKNKSNISNTNTKVTSYKKVENTSKGLLNNKSTPQINNTSKGFSTSKVTNISKITTSKINNTTSNEKNTSKAKDTFNNRSNNRTKESATLIKKTVNITSNISNKGANNDLNKKSITNTKTNTNIKNINLNNNNNKNKQTASNYTSKDYNIKKTQVETYNKYKKENINNTNTDNQKKDITNKKYLKSEETQTKEITNQYNNIAKKYCDDRNNKYNEITEINEIYETERKGKRETTPKLKLKVLGDNYKYYEGKYIPNPGELTSSYTLHQRRNQRVIYGTEEIGGTDLKRTFKAKPHSKGYRTKSKKIVKRTMMPILGAPNQYIDYSDYCGGNYRYIGEGLCYEYDDDENYNYQPQFYYQ